MTDMNIGKKPLTIGLALSGGGYRAAAFHLGTMRKLNEMGVLNRINTFSTVSGGSITGADYLLQLEQNNDYNKFEASHISKIKQSVIKQVLRSGTFLRIIAGVIFWIGLIIFLQFTRLFWLSLPLLIGGIAFIVIKQFTIFPVSKIIEKVYDNIFFGGKTLPELSKTTLIAINSTNIETGRQFTFSQHRMGDSTYSFPASGSSIKFKHEAFPISRSVMASSCVPFAFTPVSIGAEFFENVGDTSRAKPVLVDGGVFDNQGLHKLTNDKSEYACDIVVVSDAGNKMPFENSCNNLLTLLFRICDLFMNRIKKFEMTDSLYHNVILKKKEIAYISLGWDLEYLIPGFITNMKDGLVLPSVMEAHKIPPELINPFNAVAIQTHLEKRLNYAAIKSQDTNRHDIARGVGTNLTALSDTEINALINHSELMTELQVRLYCPSLVKI